MGIPSIASYAFPDANERPVNQVGWSLDSRRAMLLVHDMQNYFVAPFSADVRKRLTENINHLIQYARQHAIPICFSAQPGSMTPTQRGLLHDFWGEGMRSDPVDTTIVSPLSVTEQDWHVVKWRYSAFQRTNLAEMMAQTQRDQLILCGVYAHVGVLMTAVEAFSHDIQPFMVADAMADFNREHHLAALDYGARNCAVVTMTQEVIGGAQ
ncbi:isochorismatase family protein [Vibrio ouci]|uniref:Isochorismatase family protein n=1 Tax=Vibrio ouci TaxID=2499078 RepID=A0A4Y8W9P7_9VIBR|nr:isochorismatase family protein [Vibrio ouci]TFH89662.1 isochorismatase family protein [Vibrio ouci]